MFIYSLYETSKKKFGVHISYTYLRF